MLTEIVRTRFLYVLHLDNCENLHKHKSLTKLVKKLNTLLLINMKCTTKNLLKTILETEGMISVSVFC